MGSGTGRSLELRSAYEATQRAIGRDTGKEIAELTKDDGVGLD